jgi:hypothetical protein
MRVPLRSVHDFWMPDRQSYTEVDGQLANCRRNPLTMRSMVARRSRDPIIAEICPISAWTSAGQAAWKGGCSQDWLPHLQ